MTCNSTFVLHVAIYNIINLLTGGTNCNCKDGTASLLGQAVIRGQHELVIKFHVKYNCSHILLGARTSVLTFFCVSLEVTFDCY